MSGQNTQGQGQGAEGQNEPDWLKQLRQKARAYDSEVPQLKRDLAVSKVGIDEENPIAQLFLKSYEGDWTEDALREAAEPYKDHLFKQQESGGGEQRQQAEEPVPQQQASAEPRPEDVFAKAMQSMNGMQQASQGGQEVGGDFNLAEAKQASTAEEFMAKYQGPKS